MSGTKEQLEEIRIKNEMQVEGIDFDPAVFGNLELGSEYEEAVYTLYTMDRKSHPGIDVPECFSQRAVTGSTPDGYLTANITWNIRMGNSTYTAVRRTKRYWRIYVLKKGPDTSD